MIEGTTTREREISRGYSYDDGMMTDIPRIANFSREDIFRPKSGNRGIQAFENDSVVSEDTAIVSKLERVRWMTLRRQGAELSEFVVTKANSRKGGVAARMDHERMQYDRLTRPDLSRPKSNGLWRDGERWNRKSERRGICFR